MAEPARIRGLVCYATPLRAVLRPVEVEEGCTIEQAIRSSAILDEIPEIDLATQPVGVFGKKRALSDLLRDGDRVEMYRPLVADPKESRRRRALKG